MKRTEPKATAKAAAKTRAVKTPRLTKKQVLEACVGCMGIQANVYRKLKISRRAFYDYRRRWPEVQQAIDDELQHGVDYAESQLMQLIRQQDLRAITFFLERKGGDRGWNGKQQIELTTQPLQPIICFHATPPEKPDEDDDNTTAATGAETV